MKNQPITPQRPLDLAIEQYASFHQKPANRVINYICIPLIVFSVLGFVWSIPFPHLAFLGKYNGFINWASFIIAFGIYYYLKLSPMLSYLMLFTFFGFTYIIIQFEKDPVLPQVCVFLFVMANVAQFIGYRIEGRKPTFADEFKFMLVGPMWLWTVVLKKFGVKY
jgi:uncharacterized membrane protein YGL010W